MTSPKALISSNHDLIGLRIAQGRLELMSVLGLGAYGVVYLARDLTSPDLKNPKLYAVKALNKVGLDARQKSFQRREIALHSLASSHPSIVTLHAIVESPSCNFVILDYCPDGDLFGMITEQQRYIGKTESIRSVFIQIIDAVQYCHRLGIGHRDLKPENILCKNNGAEVVLADFGLATAERTSSDFGCGSTFYMSPECLGGLLERPESYSTLHNDIWSLGVILINLTCGRNPWKQACPSDETFRAYLSNPDFLCSILPISKSCNLLLKRIFTIDPFSRISLDELKHEILRIKTFNLSTAELGRASRATRQAALALRTNLTSTCISQRTTIHFSSPKVLLSKETKNFEAPQLKMTQVHACGSTTPSGLQVRRPEARNDEIVSNRAQQSVFSSSVTSIGSRKLTHIPALCQSPPKSPKNSSYQSATATRTDLLPESVLEKPSDFELGSSEPMVSSKSSSPSKTTSASCIERSKLSQGFSRGWRKFSYLASTFNDTSKDETTVPMSCKQFCPKPAGFNHPNAPCPIVVQPDTMVDSHQPYCSLNARGSMTPRSKRGIQYFPCTPPSSVSPGKTAFGFIKKPSRFLHSSGNCNHYLPSTPSTPKHPNNVATTSCNSDRSTISVLSPRRYRKILTRSLLMINYPEKKSRNSLNKLPSDDEMTVTGDQPQVGKNLEMNNKAGNKWYTHLRLVKGTEGLG